MTNIKNYMPDEHAKFLLDYYNLFDGNEPYQDRRGPYRDKLLNELYHNIYEGDLQASNGNIPHTFFNGETIRFLDKDQKIEKLKKSFDIFKRLKERDLVLASMYIPHRYNFKQAINHIEYSDYDRNENTHLYLLREKALIGYILYLFDPMHIQAFLYIRDHFPNIEITENMMKQHLMYKGR